MSIDKGYLSQVVDTQAIDGERCPVCRTRLVVKEPDEIVIRNAILKVQARSGKVTAKCTRCKTWVEVPLKWAG